MTDRYIPPSGPRGNGSNRNQDQSNDRFYQSNGPKRDSRYSNQSNYRSNGPRRDNYRPDGRTNDYHYQASASGSASGANVRSNDYRNDNYRNSGNVNNRFKDLPTGPSAGAKGPTGPRGSHNPTKRPFTNDTNRTKYYNNDSSRANSYIPTNSRLAGGYEPNKRPKFPEGPGGGLPKGPKSMHHNRSSYIPPGPKYNQKNLYHKPIKPIIPTKLTSNQIYIIKSKKTNDVFERIYQVGEGTYGKVYKAKNDTTNEIVALKKLRLETEKDGFPITSIREIKLLQSFDHPNVVGLLEMMVESNQIYMIFDYMDHDLTGLLTHPDLILQESHCKYLFKQLMEGLNYLHGKRVIHRDIKGSNILIDSIGNLKIADFGLARTMKLLKEGESPDYTNRVITIWYRPPELLLGSTDYGREIDIWGVGCLLIELYTKMAAFKGFDEVSQLNKIFNIMGTPSFENWPEIQNLPWFEMLKPKINKVNQFDNFKDMMSPESFKLAEALLQLNPHKRLTASEALDHEYFKNDPKPEPLYFLKDIKGEWHEFETKRRRRKERKRLQEEKEKQKSQEKKISSKNNTDNKKGNNSTSQLTDEIKNTNEQDIDINDNIAPSGPSPENYTAPPTGRTISPATAPGTAPLTGREPVKQGIEENTTNLDEENNEILVHNGGSEDKTQEGKTK